jgi:tetratricopeptide (TPR) repeat protein
MGADRLPQDGRRRAPRWGAPPYGRLQRAVGAIRRLLGGTAAPSREGLPALPLALRHGELATAYLSAEAGRDHRRAGTAASQAMERAMAIGDWWPADAWGHRALWHFEQADLTLQAARAARRIGDVRSAAGDPSGARRYYAEAISEARDIGAEREEGLAAFGLGHATLALGDVTMARRLAGIAADLLERANAPSSEVAAARELRGSEKPVGGA